MNSDCYFDKCKDCMYKEYNGELLGCLKNRLGLAFYKTFEDMPIINKFINSSYRYCYMYDKE